MLVDRYCPISLRVDIKASEQNNDCLVRPYLDRRRAAPDDSTGRSRFKPFSWRNFPLHLDQLEELRVPWNDVERYVKIMAETLAILHWDMEIDANDVEYVLAPHADSQSRGEFTSSILDAHTMWILYFDLCRVMPANEAGIQQAVTALFRNDPYYPRPRASRLLWEMFRDQYLVPSGEIIAAQANGDKRIRLPGMFVEMIESRDAEGAFHPTQ